MESKDSIDQLVSKIANTDIKITKQNINTTFTNKKYTPLMMVSFAENDRVDLLNSLIDAGAKLDLKDLFGRTALMLAIIGGNVEVAKQLIEKGANINEKDTDGNTPLIYASQYGNVEVAKQLIEKGANINEKNNNNKTALLIKPLYTDLPDLLENNTAVKRLIVDKLTQNGGKRRRTRRRKRRSRNTKRR
jgi:ankyrin repeat protein